MKVAVLDPDKPGQPFPPVSRALAEPDGLLAVGGCLSEQRLLAAYRAGVFPWYSPGEPILWWSPDPRMVLFPDELRVARSLAKVVRKRKFDTSFDLAFSQVLDGCAGPREGADGTWISQDIKQAYLRLHRAGFAHSAEAWLDGALVGGLYGVALGQVFFGESMFHTATDASKVALVWLVGRLRDWGYQLVDCQLSSAHLASLGAREIARAQFVGLLERLCAQPPAPAAWRR